MKKLVLIQTGEPVPLALERYGNFDDWFIQCLDVSPDRIDVHRVFETHDFPQDQDLAGIIISGSPAMITDNHSWSKQTKVWLRPHLEKRTPILGVCYGHQLLARLLGGEVDWNPRGREIGQVTLNLNSKAEKDPLFDSYLQSGQQQLQLFASHLQSVISLPQDVEVLGTTDKDPYHCFRYKNHVWGFQFHPEFNAEITKSFIEARKEDILSEGDDPQSLINEMKDNCNGCDLLMKFRDLCFKH